MHQSKVGNPRVYEAEDRRITRSSSVPESHSTNADKSHKTYIDFDPSDKRSLGEKLASTRESANPAEENKKTVRDPLARALLHGHEPSHGAQIDAEILAEEQEILRGKEK